MRARRPAPAIDRIGTALLKPAPVPLPLPPAPWPEAVTVAPGGLNAEVPDALTPPGEMVTNVVRGGSEVCTVSMVEYGAVGGKEERRGG